MFYAIPVFLWIDPMMPFYSCRIQITKCDVSGCVAGANKSQNTYENIYIIQVGLIVRVYIVFCVLGYTCTFLSWKLLFE